MQKEEPVHMKTHRKNTHMTWRRETASEQSIQMCSSSNKRTIRCNTLAQHSSDRLPTLDLTVREQWWRNDGWSKNEYRKRKSLDKRQRGWGMQISFLKSKNKNQMKKIKQKPRLWNTARHFRSVSHARNTSKHTTTNTHHPEPNLSKTRKPLNRNQNKEKLSLILKKILLIISWQLF